jgi:transcriptional regulator with XRE-family HTH domain
MSNYTFGDFIKKAREKLKLTLQKVAAYLNIDTSSLIKVERGERPASTDYLKPLADILQLDLKEVHQNL